MMRAKIWIIIIALVVAISAIAYALYLVLQVKTDAEMVVEDLELTKRENETLINEETTKMAERSKGPGQTPASEGGSGETDSRP